MDPNLTHNAGVAGLGSVLLLSGVAVWLWVGRQRFRRRNVAGIEEFNGYGEMLLTKVFEKFLRICAVLAVVSGLLLMARAVGSNMTSLASSRTSKSISGEPAETPAGGRQHRPNKSAPGKQLP